MNLAATDQFKWTNQFFDALTHKRKVALRRGEELETQNGYVLKTDPLKKLCAGTLRVEDLQERDFKLEITQKGVDMRIGLDIASLAESGTVNQIVMITGDSDFVPAAKHARRSGIDFILDPMWATVTTSLSEHVDGIRQCVFNYPENLKDPLHVSNLEVGPKGQGDEEDEEL
ncbi:NYN domain-containing protein [Corynebacterium riegelii]|uniref:NYN domain-containing protein n=1 Tax=Corynebacterium riegelii TaxID=156976 RepID=UPI0030B8B4A3